MRRLVILGVALAVLAGAGAALVLRLSPGEAAWNAGGELEVAGDGGAWLLRPAWRRLAPGALRAGITAATSEGVSVAVAARITPAAGRYRLEPAASAGAALELALAPAARGLLARTDLDCFMGGADAICPASLAARLEAELAQRLSLAADRVHVTLEPDAAALSAAFLAALRARPRSGRRVLVIGLDGADWELLEPFARRGVMPNLARLMALGSWGDLESITPLLSPLIWTTMATGEDPATHGILDFLEVDPESGAKVPVTGRGRRVPALWNIATAAGLESVVSGWWASWPAETVNGTMISDRLFFLLSDSVADAPPGTVVYPSEREAALRRLAERAESESDEAAVRSLMPVSATAYRHAVAEGRGMADPVDGFRRILVSTRTYFGAALAEVTPDTDLALVYCIGTDEIGHLLARYLPPPLPGTDPAFATAARVAVERYFAVVDRWIGRYLELFPPATSTVLVVSDHGFKWGWPGSGHGDDRPRQFSGTAAATAALWHRPTGIFVVAGAGVAGRGRVAEAASVYDVAPTITALLSLPAGSGWSGRPLPGVAAAAMAPVDWLALVPPSSYRPQVGAGVPSPEYVAQLKALGYLESGEGTGNGDGATEGALNNLGLVQLEARRYAEAEATFRRAIARNPAYASPHYNLRRVLFETGRYAEADAALWRAVELGLRDAAGAVDRAAGDYERIGEQVRAAALLAEARHRFPDSARIAAHRLALLVALQRCGQAAAEGREAAAAFPDDPAVHAFWGVAAACAGDATAARQALERSLRLDPDQPRLRALLLQLP